jgi:hypothetical protein
VCERARRNEAVDVVREFNYISGAILLTQKHTFVDLGAAGNIDAFEVKLVP